MTHAHRLKLRCFIEGIEVPIIACNVDVQPNSPAQFQVQIPATDKAFEFLPRSLIHVFFYDYWEGASDTASVRVSEAEQVESIEDLIDRAASQDIEREEHYDRSRAETEDGFNYRTERPSDADLQAARDARASTDAVDSVLQEEGAPNAAGAVHASGEGSEQGENPFAAAPGGGDDLQENPFNDEDSRWLLLIGGEVIGYTFQKSHHQRSIVLQCMDWSIYWDTCYQYKVNVASLTGDGLAAFVGAGTTFFDTFFSSTTSAIVTAVNRNSITQPELTGLLSGVVRLLESVGGVYIGNESQSLNGANPQYIRHRLRGVNDFFSIAELRLKLVYMITAAEGDESSRRHFARRAFAWWGRRRASRLGKIASFREILNVMMQFIYHATYPVAAPRYVHPQERLRTSSRTQVTSFANSPRGRRFIQELTSLRNTAQYATNRAKYRDTDYPVGQIRSQLLSVSRRAQSAALQAQGFGHSPPSQRLNTAADAASGFAAIYNGESRTNRQVYQANRAEIDSRSSRMLRNITSAVEYFRFATAERTRTDSRTVLTGARLNQQIIRPDIYMVSPPRCNVIFPELASSISFQRMFLREVTRMRLMVSDEIFGPDQLLDRAYFAPDVEVLGARPPRRSYGRGSDAGQVQGERLSRAAYSKRLMDHELFTGVVPVFERMNEVNMYAARTDAVTHRGLRIPYVVRAVNHQFFKHRWQPRTAQLQGKFNPFVVAGFPAVIMDRYMTREQVMLSELRGTDYLERSGRTGEAMEDAGEFALDTPPGQDVSAFDVEAASYSAWRVLGQNVPNQIVGLIESINHSVAQNQASTSMVLSHSRIHRENEELLGANQRELNRRSLLRTRTRRAPRRRVGTPGGGSEDRVSSSATTPRANRGGRPIEGRAVRRTTVASLEEPEVGMVGPYFGEVTAVAPSEETGSFPFFGTFFGDRVRRQWRRFPVNTELQAIDLGEEVATQAGGRNERVTLQAYVITEAIDRWRGQEVSVPLEDFIRPPWMSDVWRNDRIGATYGQFFGTGAITDALIVNTGSAAESQAAGDPVEDLLATAAAEERDRNVQEPITSDGMSRQGAGMELNIERAIDLLVRTYSAIKHNGLDIHEFIRAYTYRPVANILDILGSRDLTIDEDGSVTNGIEGIHSRAFGRGPMGRDLRNLVGPEARQILGMETGLTERHPRVNRTVSGGGDNQTVRRSVRTSVTTETAEQRINTLSRMDKRADKSDRVLAYVEELEQTRGLLG